nr:minichromosome maintenance domain-containing protein 2 isoform X3 [Halyomorpha halys]
MQDISFTCKYTTCLKKGKILKKNGKCSDCGKELIEIARSRLSGEKVYGLFLNPNFLQPSKEYTRTQCIMVELRDELFTSLEIGIRYNLALTIEKDKYVAWGVQPMLPDPLVRAISNLAPPPFPSKISQFISTIKENTYDSPWALVTAFSSIIPGDSYPLSAFLHLKTALLLSLGSICSKSPVPILALGDCGKLMMDAWYCSPRAIFSPSSSTSLLLASYGVCLVHDNITALSFVTTAVESELVTVTNHVLPKDKSHSTYSLKAAVWMYWNCNKHSGQDVNKLKTLINIFGIPFLDNIDVNDEEISEHLLWKAIGNSRSFDIISQKDFRKFIDIISGLKVTMSEMARTLIRNYFVANRRERPECLPLKAIKVLTSLSESHARLSLRDTVTYEDAVAAIYLYEESISILFGPSVSSELPKRTVTANSPVEIARQMDTILGKFSLWLQSYTTNQNNSIPEDNDGSFQFLSTSSMNSSVNDFSTL